MKTNLIRIMWCVFCALALNLVAGCVVDHDHHGGGPDYYGHGYGHDEHHDWDHDHHDEWR